MKHIPSFLSRFSARRLRYRCLSLRTPRRALPNFTHVQSPTCKTRTFQLSSLRKPRYPTVDPIRILPKENPPRLSLQPNTQTEYLISLTAPSSTPSLVHAVLVGVCLLRQPLSATAPPFSRSRSGRCCGPGRSAWEMLSVRYAISLLLC
jgi:hypothetical protein